MTKVWEIFKFLKKNVENFATLKKTSTYANENKKTTCN